MDIPPPELDISGVYGPGEGDCPKVYEICMTYNSANWLLKLDNWAQEAWIKCRKKAQ